MSSTAKKQSINSQLSQPQLGQYRQLGPKIHEFGARNNNNKHVEQQQQNLQQQQLLQQQQKMIPQSSQGNQGFKNSRQTQSNGMLVQQIDENKQASVIVAEQQLADSQRFQSEQQQIQTTVSISNPSEVLGGIDNNQQNNQQLPSQFQQAQLSSSEFQQFQLPKFGINSSSNNSSKVASRQQTQENGSQNAMQIPDNQENQNGNNEEVKEENNGESYGSVASLKAQLRTIFDFYTTFGDRQNLNALKSSKFYKMMSDAGILNSTLTTTRLDLLFCQTNKHNPNMSFATFLEMLPKLSQLKYPQLTQEESMLALITQNFTPQYLSIMENTDLGLELRRFSQPLEIDCIEILTPLYPMLQKIYESYFPWERANSMTKDKAQARSLKALYVFLAEFNICPTHFNKSTAFLLFNYLIDLVELNAQFAVSENASTIFGFQDFGSSFTFQRFLIYLIRSAIISYENRLDTSKYPCSSHLEKLNLLLERMEVSEGNLNIQRKTHSTNNQHTSLLIPESLVVQLSVNKSIDWSTPRASQLGSLFRSRMNSGISSTRQQSSMMSALSPQRSNSSHRKSLLLEKLGQSFVSCTNAFEKHNEGLVRIFRAYCAYGEPMNQSTLKTMKLIRLLTDAKIMKKLVLSGNQTNISLQNASSSKDGGSSRRTSHGQIRLSASGNKQNNHMNIVNGSSSNSNTGNVSSASLKKEDRVLSKIDMDFMVAKLTGSKWIRQFNKESTSFNRKIQSPKLGFSSYLHRTDDATGAKGKIEYEHFLKLLEMISEKLFPELDAESSLSIIIEQILTVSELPGSPANLNVNSSNSSSHRKTTQDYLLILMDTLKDSEIVQLLGEVHLSLLIYYRIYQDMHGLMNITQFLKFFKDFEIFPAMASKPKLSTIFYALAQVQANQSNHNNRSDSQQQSLSEKKKNNNLKPLNSSSRNSNNSLNTHNQSQMSGNHSLSRSQFINDSSSSISAVPDQSESELIDQHLFVEAIALLAIDIYTEQPSNVYKILMILERMNNSDGPTRIQKKLGHTRSTDGQHWDMLHSIRRKYPQFYQSKKQNTHNQSGNAGNHSSRMNISSSSHGQIYQNPVQNSFDDIIKRSLGSAQLQQLSASVNQNQGISSTSARGADVSLSQQYALQQKENNQKAAQFYEEQEQQIQQQQQQHNIMQEQQQQQAGNMPQLLQQQQQQQHQNSNEQAIDYSPLDPAGSSPANGVAIIGAPLPSDYLSTAKKSKSAAIPSKNIPATFAGNNNGQGLQRNS